MNQHDESVSRAGAGEYLRVLFPRSWDPESPPTTVVEPQIVKEITEQLWRARERTRLAGDAGQPRRLMITVEHAQVGTVLALVCMDCMWVAWDEHVVHPWVCLDEKVRQEQDVRPLMGAMRVSRQSADLGDEPWGRYYDSLFPRRLVRDFISYKRSTSGVAMARRFWEERETLRLASSHAAAATAAGAHLGAVLTCGPHGAIAACLTCSWLGPSGVSMDEPDWQSRTASSARQHELGVDA